MVYADDTYLFNKSLGIPHCFISGTFRQGTSIFDNFITNWIGSMMCVQILKNE